MPERARYGMGVNWASPQAAGLCYWLPLRGHSGYMQHSAPLASLATDMVRGCRVDVMHPEYMGWAAYGGMEALIFGASNYPSISPYAQTGTGPAYIDITGDIAISCWIYPTNLPTTNTDGRAIFGTGATATTYIMKVGMWIERISGVNYLRCGRWSSGRTFVGASWAIDSSLIANYQWAHVWGRWRAGEWAVIVNGVVKATASDATGPSGTDGQIPRIGAIYFTGEAAAAYTWRGGMTDFRIYNRCPSDAVAMLAYDPATRWDLYERSPLEMMYLLTQASAPVGVSVPVVHHHRRIQGMS